MITRRKLMQRALAVGGAGVLGACMPTTATPQGTTRPGPTSASFQFFTKPADFNALTSADGGKRQAMSLVFASLVKFDDKMGIIADLAERWDVSPRADQFTFHLRRAAKWHDGRVVTADDVSFTLHVMLKSDSGSAWTGRLNVIKGAREYTAGTAAQVSGVEVVDASTVRITLTSPNYPFLFQLADGIHILPKHILGDVPTKDFPKHTFFQTPTVGAGPFRFVKYEVDQYVELEANPSFYLGSPKIDRLFGKILLADAIVTQLEKGELDVGFISIDDVPRFQRAAGRSLTRVPGFGITQIGVNTRKPYLADRRIRQALVHAIDREGIVRTVLQGNASFTETPFPGERLAWAVPSDVKLRTYDPDRARQLLRDAAWDANRTLVFHYVGGMKERDAIVPIVQGQLTAVGIKVDVLPVTNAVQAQRLADKAHDIFIFGGGRYQVDPDIASIYYTSDAGSNFSSYSNKRVDELFAAGRSASEQSARQAAYQEISRILHDDVPTIWLHIPDTFYVHSNRLKGYKPSLDRGAMAWWNVHEWSVSE